MPSASQRKANNGLGVCIVCLVTLLETVFAHQKRPSAASPYVWSCLAVAALAALAYHVHYRRKASDRSAGAD